MLHWANDRGELRNLRAGLRADRDGSPLFDVNAYTRSLERALLTMLERQRHGKSPATFTVAE